MINVILPCIVYNQYCVLLIRNGGNINNNNNNNYNYKESEKEKVKMQVSHAVMPKPFLSRICSNA